MKNFFVMALLCISIAVPTVGKGNETSNPWTVTLTKKQAKALANMDTRFTARALAISPDGAWGSAWDNTTEQDVRARALSFCRQHLKKGRRDCFVYSFNGRVVSEAVVSPKVVRQVYKPVNGKTAPMHFGRVPYNFNGNKSAALADYQALVSNPNHATQLKRSKSLQSALTNASFMNTSAKGFAIWFDQKGGSQFQVGNGGMLRLFFSDWTATPDGLVCMFNSVWSTGKRIGTRCLVVEFVENGAASFYWAGSSKQKRNGQLIAGDARRGDAR